MQQSVIKAKGMRDKENTMPPANQIERKKSMKIMSSDLHQQNAKKLVKSRTFTQANQNWSQRNSKLKELQPYQQRQTEAVGQTEESYNQVIIYAINLNRELLKQENSIKLRNNRQMQKANLKLHCNFIQSKSKLLISKQKQSLNPIKKLNESSHSLLQQTPEFGVNKEVISMEEFKIRLSNFDQESSSKRKQNHSESLADTQNYDKDQLKNNFEFDAQNQIQKHEYKQMYANIEDAYNISQQDDDISNWYKDTGTMMIAESFEAEESVCPHKQDIILVSSQQNKEQSLSNKFDLAKLKCQTQQFFIGHLDGKNI
ncbi:UNKNOWN [Stylonychia lemnae]|uniref:Uncharacterized protein n=1 Tax=Stylonychia lemnae TaxID=5949 RepID=A0A078AKC2_STYLE|nr:UNKNOWN [Stylonychia lemnae]|eukprot:CDW82341.1 UNKNOWN [Stylonychia lemnae]